MDEFTHRLMQGEIISAMGELLPKDAEALVRCYWYGQTQREAGRQMGTTGAMVSNRVRRGLRRLRESENSIFLQSFIEDFEPEDTVWNGGCHAEFPEKIDIDSFYYQPILEPAR